MKFIFFRRLYESFFKLKSSSEFRKSAIYFSASSIAYGIVFVQSFSIAYLSSTDFFGRVTLLISLFSTLYVIYTCGLNAVVIRFYFDNRYSTRLQSFISHISYLWVLFGIIITLLLLILGYTFLEWKKLLPFSYYSEFIPIVLASYFYSSTEIFPSIFIAQEKPFKYAFFLISSRFVIFGLLHVAIFVIGESSFFVAMALLFSGLFMFALNILIIKSFPTFEIDRIHIKEIFMYSFPLMIYALGGIGYSHGYRIIISSSLSFDEQASFTIASQIAMVYYLTAASVITGYYTKVYSALEKQNGDPRAIRFYLKLLFGIGLGVGIIVLPCSIIFLKYFKAGAFYEASNVLPLLLVGQFFFFLYSYSYVLCTFYKMTRILTLSMFVGVGTSLILALTLLEHGNLWTAAVPVMSGLITQFIVSFVVIKFHIKKIKYKSKLIR